MRQPVRGEAVQLKEDRGEFIKHGSQRVGMEQEVFLTEDGADLVGLGLADATDALADDGLAGRAGRQVAGDGLVDAGVEKEPPVLEQGRLGRQSSQLARLRREQQQRFRQLPIRFDAQIGSVGDGQQRIAAQDVALAVRHLQAGAGQAVVLLDDAAQDSRRHEERGRVRGG